MIHPRKILAKLPQYNNANEELVHKQNVADIINGVDIVHQKFANDYDLICEEFIGKTPLQTCKNLFNFLRYSTVYQIEDEDFQSLRSPASILATGTSLGIDCKNLALWIGGCLDAINRSGYQYIPFVYRFASDKEFDKTPNHVFIVAFPDTNNEIWIDPIPQVTYFNEKLRYNYFQDKNIHKMSLNILSGKNYYNTVSGGAFAFGENKLRDQMMTFIDKYPLAFLYLYLPVGHDGDQNWGTEYGWNSYELQGIPNIVKQKRNKAFWTMWNWGLPTGLQAETQIVQFIRDAITKKLGTSPEEYWNKKLNVNIRDKAAFGGKIGFEFTDAADAVIPGSGKVLKFAGPILDSLVPDLTWEHQPDTFQPVAEDWKGTIYESKFPINSKTNQYEDQSIVNTQDSSQAGMNIYVTLGLVGVGIYLISRMKK